ncbi:protocatechuate 4,5-dioxygenase subunit alpha [Reinekea blandensis]|uniref:Possible protocatechuate 4,5-dioxygenase small subunit (AB035121) n=1 Tax=Reinekea blandensis MED297 TaxID=314283 RepID=A4BGY1_9GAMM|nr:protocatechuate 4,5-dioxygenase subunit alpha [Reinekea blandensis]EAR08627.1 possible protocatechuate 4,5-dioxygenase small subunit (AB035121) [Reinekea sp. MED297] [Reinekea blandensis MED297]
MDYKPDIPGNTFFNGEMAAKGYNLNKMFHSLNSAAGREAFRADERAYCEQYRLTPEQTETVLNRDLIRMIELGGSIYYMAKFAGVLGLNVQDVGGLQTGRSTEEFQAYLDSQGRGKTHG